MVGRNLKSDRNTALLISPVFEIYITLLENITVKDQSMPRADKHLLLGMKIYLNDSLLSLRFVCDAVSSRDRGAQQFFCKNLAI